MIMLIIVSHNRIRTLEISRMAQTITTGVKLRRSKEGVRSPSQTVEITDLLANPHQDRLNLSTNLIEIDYC